MYFSDYSGYLSEIVRNDNWSYIGNKCNGENLHLAGVLHRINHPKDKDQQKDNALVSLFVFLI